MNSSWWWTFDKHFANDQYSSFSCSDSAGLLMLSTDDFCRRVWLAGNQGSTSSSSSSCTCRKNLLGRRSVTISTISSSRQCRRQYIYACELAAAPFSTPSSPARSTHLMRSTCCMCGAALCCWCCVLVILLLLVGWWSYRREKRKSLSAAMSAVVSAVESISTLHA